MLLNHHFWASTYVSGWGVGAFSPANDSTQVRLKAPQNTATECRPDRKKVANTDVAQRKLNMALRQNGKQIKLVPE